MSESAPPAAPREVSSAASCLTVLLAVGAGTALCCMGLGTLAVRAGVAAETERVRGRVEEQRAEDERHLAAEALLDEIGAHLEAVRDERHEFPPALPEAPPRDPWGTELRYEPGGPDRAWLRSAGPDGAFDSPDDLVRALRAR